MSIQRIVFFSATVVAMLLAVCASVSHKPVGESKPTIMTDRPDGIFSFEQPVFPVEATSNDRLNYDDLTLDFSVNDVIRISGQRANRTFLRNTNLVPTDLFGTGAEKLAWHEEHAIHVDNGSANIFGAEDGVPINLDLDGSLRILDQSIYRTPGSDPDPDR